jgi:splicing factor 3A subunit 1
MVLHGVIRPPPEIRAVADRTALYVAKNGRAFEERILGSEKGRQPKFSFLQGDSPFHSYYEGKVRFYEQGGTDDDGGNGDGGAEKDGAKGESKKGPGGDNGGKPPPAPSAKAKAAAAIATATPSAIDPVARAVLAQRARIAAIRSSSAPGGGASSRQPGGDEGAPRETAAGTVVPPPPPPLAFVSAVAPSSLTERQLEVVQLVAQMTALDRSFLLQLSAREWNNPEFGFCQPRHGHFAYFSALVDAYRRVLASWTAADPPAPSDSAVGDLPSTVEDCLERAAYRAEYERDAELQRMASHQASAAPPILVDWHDFVVVETIDFPADEVVDPGMMPPPPPPLPAVPPPSAAAAAPGGDGMDESDEDDDDDDQEQIRLVPNYQPRVVGPDAGAPQYVIDPITGRSVAARDVPEHLRIQLLDPRWAEERKKFQDRQRDSNLVSGDVVASNLERLAQARGGARVRCSIVVGPRNPGARVSHQLSFRCLFLFQEHDLLTKESDSKKRLAEANRVIREQGQGAAGPFLPAPDSQQPPQQSALKPPPAAPAPDGAEEPPPPPSKRPRVDRITMVEAPPLPSATPRVPAPPGFDAAALPPIDPTAAALEEPFAGAGEAAAAAAAPPAAPLLSEADFAASLASPDVALQVRVPNDRTQIAWNFYGQTVSHAAPVTSTVRQIKERLSEAHLNGMPANKIQLRSVATGAFLKDSLTLAALNIGPAATLELVPRARGGRK